MQDWFNGWGVVWGLWMYFLDSSFFEFFFVTVSKLLIDFIFVVAIKLTVSRHRDEFTKLAVVEFQTIQLDSRKGIEQPLTVCLTKACEIASFFDLTKWYFLGQDMPVFVKWVFYWTTAYTINCTNQYCAMRLWFNLTSSFSLNKTINIYTFKLEFNKFISFMK